MVGGAPSLRSFSGKENLMKKNTSKKSLKLQLNRETLSALEGQELREVAGGLTQPYASCRTCGSVCATATQLC
jgi:natural product precursor